jgi:group I intron endonuclease
VIVYRLLSPSGKSYIGITSRGFAARWRQHLSDWRLRKAPHVKLYQAFDRYHPDLWRSEILFTGSLYEELKERERGFIREFDSVANGYNITHGGDGALGRRHTEEAKRRISKLNSGRKNPYLAALNRARKGIPRSVEHRERIAKAQVGHRGYNLGKKFSAETRRKMSEARKRWWESKANG